MHPHITHRITPEKNHLARTSPPYARMYARTYITTALNVCMHRTNHPRESVHIPCHLQSRYSVHNVYLSTPPAPYISSHHKAYSSPPTMCISIGIRSSLSLAPPLLASTSYSLQRIQSSLFCLGCGCMLLLHGFFISPFACIRPFFLLHLFECILLGRCAPRATARLRLLQGMLVSRR